MYVLDKLWRGKLSPNEQCCNYGSEYSNLHDVWLHKGKLIAAELSEDGKNCFWNTRTCRNGYPQSAKKIHSSMVSASVSD